MSYSLVQKTFGELDQGDCFKSNGTNWVKQGTKTARVLGLQYRLYHFKDHEVVDKIVPATSVCVED